MIQSDTPSAGDTPPVPNNLRSSPGPGPSPGFGSGSGPSPGPDLLNSPSNMANGLNKRPTRDSAPPSRSGSIARSQKWWKIRLFQGMANDLRRRAPYYWSDWKDAFDYRVVPATVYMYFANILPALAFSLDMFSRTDSHYGVNEVLLASVLGAVVFSFAACQPLVIVGVTGPITVFNYTVFDIMMPTGVNYLAFMTWIGLWALVMHWVLAVTNSCNWLRFVTRFPCDIFGFYVACIYLQKGVDVLLRQGDGEPFYLSTMVALLVFAIAYVCGELGKSSLFHHHVRVFLKDYGTPLTVVFFSGFVHMGRMRDVRPQDLPTSTAFFPTQDRGWLVEFWDVRVSDVFLAIPFALLLTILFWFDHNVSSLIAQGTEFPLKKPAGFHWDLFLLGLTTGVAGILGLPFPNGLIPQAPFHTESLCVTKVIHHEDEGGDNEGHWELRRTHVVEQRVSNLAQGLLTLGTMTGPLLVVLHLIPQGVLAGLFFIMGYQALESNGITAKVLFLLRDRTLTPARAPLRRLQQLQGRRRRRRRRAAVWLFVAIELAGFGATFAITQTVAAVGFPVIILALIPVRALLLPRLFTPQELGVLDAPTASPFTMESVGGIYGAGALGGADDEDGGSNNNDEGPDGTDNGKRPRGGGSGGGEGLFENVEGDKSEEDLAELGENNNVRLLTTTTSQPGPHRRRNSATARDDEGRGSIEMKRIGVDGRVTSEGRKHD